MNPWSHWFFRWRIKKSDGFEFCHQLFAIYSKNVVRILTEFKEVAILETKGRKIIVVDVNKLIAITDFKISESNTLSAM